MVNKEFRVSCLYRGIRCANIPSFLTTEARIISKVAFVFVFLCVAQSGNIGIHLSNIISSLTHTHLSFGVIFRQFHEVPSD